MAVPWPVARRWSPWVRNLAFLRDRVQLFLQPGSAAGLLALTLALPAALATEAVGEGSNLQRRLKSISSVEKPLDLPSGKKAWFVPDRPANEELDCLGAFDRGCPEIHDRRTCLGSRDGQKRVQSKDGLRIRGEPCVWCGGVACTTANFSVLCAPHDYLARGEGVAFRAFNAKSFMRVAKCKDGHPKIPGEMPPVLAQAGAGRVQACGGYAFTVPKIMTEHGNCENFCTQKAGITYPYGNLNWTCNKAWQADGNTCHVLRRVNCTENFTNFMEVGLCRCQLSVLEDSFRLVLGEGQCGGSGWSGPTECQEGFECVRRNTSFWQCELQAQPTTVAVMTSTTTTSLVPTSALAGGFNLMYVVWLLPLFLICCSICGFIYFFRAHSDDARTSRRKRTRRAEVPSPTQASRISESEGTSLFDIIDRNHDGVLTQAEFEAAMGVPAGSTVTTVAVPSMVTTVQQVEVIQPVQAVQVMQPVAAAAMLPALPARRQEALPRVAYRLSSAPGGQGPELFDLIDRNHDGAISQAEMAQAFGVQAPPRVAHGAPSAQALPRVAYGGGQGLDLFDLIDRNHDGAISQAEMAQAFGVQAHAVDRGSP